MAALAATAVVGGLGMVSLASNATAGEPQQTQEPSNTRVNGTTQWVPRWTADPASEGLKAFEGVEDDRAGSDPGVKHIYVKDGAYRFDMPLKERDSSPDRQRNEVKGMRTGDTDLQILKGQTWRFTDSVYIPSSLEATTSFTHIMQFKKPGSGSAPIMVMSLRQHDGTPTIEFNSALSGKIVGRTALGPLQNKWIGVDLEVTFDDKDGAINWKLTDGSGTIVDAHMSGLDTWLGQRARPKWGIYRSLKDKTHLKNAYLLVKDLKAYQQTS